MDADELRLLNGTLLGLAESERNGLITTALDTFGWRDMLTAQPEQAISALFDAQGRTGTWSAALHDVLAIDVESFGMTRPVSVVLPQPGSSRPGALRDGKVAVDGILLGPRAEAATLVVVLIASEGEDLVVTVEPEDLRIERRQGLDPAQSPKYRFGRRRASEEMVGDGTSSSPPGPVPPDGGRADRDD
jgi:hypothetical protein